GDPLWVVDEADRGQRDDLVVERDREALLLLHVRGPGGEQVLTALRLALGGPGERLAARVGELERDDRLARLRVGRLLRVPDVRSRQLGVVLEHVEGRGQ